MSIITIGDNSVSVNVSQNANKILKKSFSVFTVGCRDVVLIQKNVSSVSKMQT